jgi:hypothetical protein
MKTSFATLLTGIATATCLHAQSVALVSIETKAAAPAAAEDVLFGQFPKEGIKSEAGFLVTPGEGLSIVSINEDKCKVNTVVDAATMQPVQVKLKFGNFPRTSKEDGGPAYLTLEYTGAPAGTLKVAGSIHAMVAKGTETEKNPRGTLSNGKTVKAGDLTLKVADLLVGEDKIKLSLTATKSMANIKKIRFTGADGQEIKSERRGSSRMNMLGAFKEEWEFEVATGDKELGIEIETYKSPEASTIPFELTLPASL